MHLTAESRPTNGQKICVLLIDSSAKFSLCTINYVQSLKELYNMPLPKSFTGLCAPAYDAKFPSANTNPELPEPLMSNGTSTSL